LRISALKSSNSNILLNLKVEISLLGMDALSLRELAMALAIGLGAIGPAIAIGLIGAKGAEAIGRNPDAAPKIQTGMILAIAFAEAVAIYALVIAILIKFV